jgi:hypothetical protein
VQNDHLASRVTLATIEAAAICRQRRSPWPHAACAIGNVGDPEGSHQHDVGQRRQRRGRRAASPSASLMDVDVIDFARSADARASERAWRCDSSKSSRAPPRAPPSNR